MLATTIIGALHQRREKNRRHQIVCCVFSSARNYSIDFVVLQHFGCNEIGTMIRAFLLFLYKKNTEFTSRMKEFLLFGLFIRRKKNHSPCDKQLFQCNHTYRTTEFLFMVSSCCYHVAMWCVNTQYTSALSIR